MTAQEFAANLHQVAAVCLHAPFIAIGVVVVVVGALVFGD